jgi:hypothetical protein
MFHSAAQVLDGDFLSFFDITERMDGEASDVCIPCILRIMAARMIEARCLEEKATLTGFGAERQDVRPGNTKEWAVIPSVSIVKSKECPLMVPV